MTQPQKNMIAVDVMGAEAGVAEVIRGCALALKQGLTCDIKLFGREDELGQALAQRPFGADEARFSLCHADDIVKMTDKPAQIMRRGRKTSMWAAIEAVKRRDCAAAISCGNTGALMAISVLQLRMIKGVDRPAITALWPTDRGSSVVLDVGANVEASAAQLVQFAIMGEAYYRSLTGKKRPRVGLLNVGAEELKGHDLIRLAAETLRQADPEMDFAGFIEGDDISLGSVDVVVTDGFTGNIALKTAEGTARLIGGWIKATFMQTVMGRVGAFVLRRELMHLKGRMNPSNVNGAPLLGLNGLVMKAHGSSDAEGLAAALHVTERLVKCPFDNEVKETIERVTERAQISEGLQPQKAGQSATVNGRARARDAEKMSWNGQGSDHGTDVLSTKVNG